MKKWISLIALLAILFGGVPATEAVQVQQVAPMSLVFNNNGNYVVVAPGTVVQAKFQMELAGMPEGMYKFLLSFPPGLNLSNCTLDGNSIGCQMLTSGQAEFYWDPDSSTSILVIQFEIQTSGAGMGPKELTMYTNHDFQNSGSAKGTVSISVPAAYLPSVRK